MTLVIDEKYLEAQVLAKKIDKWHIHTCSMCGYQCGYLFLIRNDKVEVRYDAGCRCARGPRELRSMTDALQHIQINCNRKTGQAHNEHAQFWGFDAGTATVKGVTKQCI